MTEEDVKKSARIERAAELAGGYVAPPWILKDNPQGEKYFAVARKYAADRGISMRDLTTTDYESMGIVGYCTTD